MVIFCIEERRARKKEKFHCLAKKGREKKSYLQWSPSSLLPGSLPPSPGRREEENSRPPASKKGKKKRPKSPVLFGGGRATPALFPSPLHPPSAVEEDCRSRTLLRTGCFHFSPWPAGTLKGCVEEGVLLSAHPPSPLASFHIGPASDVSWKISRCCCCCTSWCGYEAAFTTPFGTVRSPGPPFPPALPPPVIVASFPVPASSASSFPPPSFHGSRCSMALQKREAR